MTVREAAIVTMYTGFLIGKFSDAHAYAEEIMGRPIFTHEFAIKEVVEQIKAEAKKDFVDIVVGDEEF